MQSLQQRKHREAMHLGACSGPPFRLDIGVGGLWAAFQAMRLTSARQYVPRCFWTPLVLPRN